MQLLIADTSLKGSDFVDQSQHSGQIDSGERERLHSEALTALRLVNEITSFQTCPLTTVTYK